MTDHDEIGGQHRAAAAAKAYGMRYLTGTEISVTFIGHTVHIVGLGFDANDMTLQSGLRQTRGGREERAMEIRRVWQRLASKAPMRAHSSLLVTRS